MLEILNKLRATLSAVEHSVGSDSDTGEMGRLLDQMEERIKDMDHGIVICADPAFFSWMREMLLDLQVGPYRYEQVV